MSKKALVCGITGQDGAYLAKFLLSKGYHVSGTSRDKSMANLHNLNILGITNKVELYSMSLNDFRSVLQVLSDVKADEIYYLSGQSSVGLSFEQPTETMESISIGMLNLLEVIRFLSYPTKIYNAGSSECYGNLNLIPADETTPFRPRSPYAVAKSTSHWLISNYREAYDLYACNGILFNHESPLRPSRFVTKKIISTANRIANGSGEKLIIGNIDVVRDWGWAPEYVEAMWKMMQMEKSDDYVIATGKSFSLKEFIKEAFAFHDLDWKEYVAVDKSLYRPTDIAWNQGDPSKANKILNWSASLYMPDIVKKMSVFEQDTKA